MIALYNRAGIYRWRIDRPGLPPRFYIGHAAVLRKRRNKHLSELRRHVHKNPVLQRAFDKYGESAFSFEILLICEKSGPILEFYEQRILDSYADDEIYNLCRECVGSKLGIPMPAAQKAKIGAANKGRKPAQACIEASKAARPKGSFHTEEFKQKTAERMLGNTIMVGRTLSEEHKQHVGDAFRGKKRPPEVMAKAVATRRKNAEERGYWLPPEAIAQMIKTLTGRTLSVEHRAAISAGNTGNTASLETRQKISAAHKDKPKSPEHRAKISATLLAKNAAKKAGQDGNN